MRALSIPFALSAALLAISGLSASAHERPELVLEEARVDAMQIAATDFLATLDERQRAQVVSTIDDVTARTKWSNLPISMAPRDGLAVADMTIAQRTAFHAMIAAALSSQGYLKTTTIMWHEDVLRSMVDSMLAEMEDDDPNKANAASFAENYDAEKFFVRVFGDPADEEWGWLLTGHHFAASITVSHGRIAFVPLFLGASPQVVPEGRYAGWRILQHEADRALALLGALRPDQLELALVSGEVDESVFAGPGIQSNSRTKYGIAASGLDPFQMSLLDDLLDEYLGDASNEAAARQRAAIEADGMDALRFAWWGPTDQPRGRYMFRVQGPSVLIDFIREKSPDGGFNHVHSIMRDPSNDYGAKWLQRHYQESHPK